jgi:hypothetical protein
MSEIEPTSDKEIIQIKAEPVPVEPKSRQIELVRPVPQTLTWLGAALAFAGREIVPRLAAFLLDAWDRRASRSTAPSSDRVSEQSTPSLTANSSREGGGQRHRQRRRGK